jgi:serine-type D-Ala-D-Ala carboxypeptidase/endopeptidase (penicillin-binding protein 4)
MTKENLRLNLYIPLIISLAFITVSGQSLKEIVNETKNSPQFSNATWGVYAEYTDTGEELVNSDGHKSLAPASNLKLFTSAAALHYLGADFRFTTEIHISGNIDNDGTLKGDIIIKGGGDPTLGFITVSGSLPIEKLMQQWAAAVMTAGIKRVNGNIIADDFLFDRNPLPDYYPWIDMGNYYGAGTSALTIHDNLYYLYFKPGTRVGDPAEILRTYPEIPGLTFINNMKTGKEGSGDNGYIYAAPNQFNAVLRGTIPAGVKEFSIKGSIPNPPLFAVQQFHLVLQKHNIEITGYPAVADEKIDYKGSKLIHTTHSPPLSEIVYIVNKKSNNLYTEQLLKMTGLKVSGEGSYQKGVEALRKYLSLMNVPDYGLRLFDGSGLSRNNMITPQMMGKLLTAVTKQDYFDPFYHSLGIAGDPSDISAFATFGANTLLANNARIKSGTVNGVRGHSGYVRTKSGRLVSFSFIANNFSVSASKVNEAHIRFLKTLAEGY